MARILVIDDEELVRFSLQVMLEEEGHEVVLAENGEDGIEEVERNGFDLIVTDIVMPKTEGVATISGIKRDHPSVPILAISGGGRIGKADFLDDAAAAGADAVLKKPFNEQDFYEKVDALLKP